MDQNFLELAYQTRVTRIDGDHAGRENVLYQRWNDLLTERSRRLPIEVSAITVLDTQIVDVVGEILHLEMARNGYSEQLDVDILTWRYKEGRNKGLPVFMILPLDRRGGNTFRITGDVRFHRSDDSIRISPHMPDFVFERYQDIAPKLCKHIFFGDDVELSIAASFTGVLPDTTLQAIGHAESTGFFKNIFLIAQVDDWKVTQTVVRIDPIVVGDRDDRFFIIDKFDLKPLEQYAAEQFAWRGD